ncbi:MAG: polymer-forming cytoskeletal protein [Clostridiales bacterium]|jgi:cytoskeletal protein CcmA (bactofilin family)|nr:polymer-forming cytoskeletal protein [Clostridiales bacterium]
MALLKKVNFNESAETTELSIPRNTSFTGNITTQSNARINGTVSGDITSESGNILFGVGSSVTGNVSGVDIAVGGDIRGDITANGQLSVFTGAKVFGNVHANAMVIEKDAIFEGHVKIEAGEKKQLGSTHERSKNKEGNYTQEA